MRLLATLILATAILTAIAYLRPPEYDEAYSIFLTTARARPLWPTGIFTPSQVQSLFTGPASFVQIAHDLRTGDVHPPLYFWLLNLWRAIFGPSWFTARLLSVCFAIASLGLVARLAASLKIPALPAILIISFAYGFAYTSIIARGFAMADFLNLLGLCLILETRHAGECRHPRLFSVLAGLAFGAASFTNYLACFTAVGILTVTFLNTPRTAVIAAAGFTLFLPADFYFFAAQHATRTGQFQPFNLHQAIVLILKDEGASWFGGLPLYAGHAGSLITILLATLSLICAFKIFKYRKEHTSLLVITAAATPLGLLTLGLIFNNTPIEIRYCAFSIPFIALVLAHTQPAYLRNILIAVQSCAIIGLAVATSTAQPQALAARQATPETVILVPFGNDGVGIPGPFIEAAASNQPIYLIHDAALPNLSAQTHVTLATIAIDNASKINIPLIESELNQTCRLTGSTSLTRTYQQCHSHQQP